MKIEIHHANALGHKSHKQFLIKFQMSNQKGNRGRSDDDILLTLPDTPEPKTASTAPVTVSYDINSSVGFFGVPLGITIRSF